LIAYSQLGLKPWEFWNEINPRDFVKMCEGFNLRNKIEEAKRIGDRKILRWVGYMQYVMHRDPKKRMLRPDEMYFIDEPEREKKHLKIPTKEEMKEIWEWPNARKLNDESIFEALNKKTKK